MLLPVAVSLIFLVVHGILLLRKVLMGRQGGKRNRHAPLLVSSLLLLLFVLYLYIAQTALVSNYTPHDPIMILDNP